MNQPSAKRMQVRLAAVSAAYGVLLTSLGANAQHYDATADFSSTSNPNGVWSYGYSPSGGAGYSMVLFDLPSSGVWLKAGYTPSGTPSFWKNFDAHYSQYGVAPGQISLHPGPASNGDFAILRFTAPTAGIYQITGQFYAGDSGSMSGSIVRAGNLQSPLQTFASTSDQSAFTPLSLTLASGETLDFVVGNNGSFYSGNTPLSVSITASPGIPLNVSISGSGRVTSDTGGIDCLGESGTCTADFPGGQLVTLTATAAEGYAFNGWSGACTQAAPACTLSVDSAVSVGASFVAGNTQAIGTVGFNLLGNGTADALQVHGVFGSSDAPVAGVSTLVDAVWSWNVATGKWRFHTPQLSLAQSAAYATAKDYEVLTTVPPGEGYWVNAVQPLNLVTPNAAPFSYGVLNFAALPRGLNLLAIGASKTSRQLANSVGEPPSPPETVSNSFDALWAWDAQRSMWYFYSPALEQTGASFGNCQYATAQRYLDFAGCPAANGAAWVRNPDAPALSLTPGMGFWIDKP